MPTPAWLNEFPSLKAMFEAWMAREVVPIEVFNAMAEETRASAFSAVVTMNDNQRKRLLDAIGKAIVEGQTVKDLRDAVAPLLENPAYADLVYRVNTTNAFNGAKYGDMFGKLGADYPYWRFNAVMDSRNDEDEECPNTICRALDGKVFAKNDAALRHLLPPVHFQCRCIAEEIGQEEAGTLTVASSFHLRPASGWDFDKLSLVPGGMR
jgi:SPP1 gp7 family putative phage head morphogenesis protein